MTIFISPEPRYARGFLFPSEQERIQKEIMGDIERWDKAKSFSLTAQGDPDSYMRVFGPRAAIPPSWVRSTVTTFHVPYSPPFPDLPLNYSVEALVEGSEMSQLTKRMCIVSPCIPQAQLTLLRR